MNVRAITRALTLGAILQCALFVGACIALAASDVDVWSARLDGLFGVASVGQLAILWAVSRTWPGPRTRLATVALALAAFGLSVRLVAAVVDFVADDDPVALIVSSFAPMFIGLFLVGIAMLRTTGRADQRSWVPVVVAVVGFLVGNLHQVSHRLDFTASGTVWGLLWIGFAIATRSRTADAAGAVPAAGAAPAGPGRSVRPAHEATARPDLAARA
jgi:hypothetical protein